MAPSSTYRIQFHAGFTFHHLEEILDYLHELGISTIYASPITTATRGSQHGYDVTDALILSPDIGTERELERLAGILKKKDMNWLQDIVPNHMAFDTANTWLYDVLERGRHSEFYPFFDIDTGHSTELFGNKIMLPFLGKTLTECVQTGELTLAFAGNGFAIRYFDKEFPVSAFSYQWIATLTDGCPRELLASLQDLQQSALRPLATWSRAKEEWTEKVSANPEWQLFLRQRIGFFNQQPALISELLDSQHYIPAHWSLSASHINYRRFFTVNSLICLRMEDPVVFSAYHEKISEWMQKRYIQSLRIDHIDGLAFPRQYIERLRTLFGRDCYIIAEKILASGEALPEDWSLQGTTGYDFLSIINQLLTDENGYKEIQAFYRERIGDQTPYEDIVFAKKYNFLKTQMGGEWSNLLNLLLNLPLLGADKMDKERLKEALGILMAALPVYRVYPEPPALGSSVLSLSGLHGKPALPSEPSLQFIRQAFATARKKMAPSGDDNPFPPPSHPELDFLEALFRGSKDPEKDWQQQIFQARLMQFTGPLAAKGVEDTTFYVYNPLISRNEVGDNPGIAGMTSDAFHEEMLRRRTIAPYSLNATTTHDTKRGEDSRIRLNWLSAHSSTWIEKIKDWTRINRSAMDPVAKDAAPTPNDEYLIYQSLAGSFPQDLVVTDAFRERMHQYLTKALREAKTNTNWDKPDEAYEKRCHDFLSSILEQQSSFLEDFIPFIYEVIHGSAPYSLSQELVKLTAPGIPDIYQGAEGWDLSLVDPDNRSSVDYTLRRHLLRKIKEEEIKGPSAVLDFVTANSQKGAGKLFILYRTLAYRRLHPQVFTTGDYIPMKMPAPLAAYVRRHKTDWALVIFPLIRKEIPVPDSFSIILPAEAPTEWTNLFTGESIQHADNKEELRQPSTDAGQDNRRPLELKGALSTFPVALFVGRSTDQSPG